MTKLFKKETFSSGAEKHLEGKLRMDLITPEMINALAEGLTYGCVKYTDRNWEKGIPFMSSYASTMRHLVAWLSGTDVDPESGIEHVKLAMLNLAFIVTQTERKRFDLDDRKNSKYRRQDLVDYAILESVVTEDHADVSDCITKSLNNRG